MRRCSLLLVAILALSACHREPSFDERYETASKKIGETAKDIDAQITGTGTPPGEAGASPRPVPVSQP
ncbi:MAG: hypothetical protein E2586_11965 [Novosphingobium sp.]|nr:hypothetical protein [Novosphingobium sp.]